MADQAHEWTDEEIERLERRFRRQYNQASREMRKRLDDMMESYDKANAEWKQRVKSGDATQEDYDGWLKDQATDRAFVQSMAQTLAQDANRTNQLAMDTVNDAIPSVFAENANYAAFEVEHGIGYETHAFDLYDQSTVRRLIRDQPDLLPPLPNPRMDNGRDLRWNRQRFAGVITQSVLQGESIPRAADRIGRVMRTNEAAATMAARTALTGAENAGRVDSYKRAQNIGIELEQEWMATLDERTRMSHRELDGQHVPVGKYFIASNTTGNKLLFPGDPSAPGEDVYNCRCTLVAWLPSIAEEDNRSWAKMPDEMTYDEWKHGKKVEKERKEDEAKAVPKTKPHLRNVTGVKPVEWDDAPEGYYLPDGTRKRLHEIEKLGTYDEFVKYFDGIGIKLTTDLESLSGKRRNDVIRAVQEQCQKIAVAIDAYRETFGPEALSKLTRIHLYDNELPNEAAYHFNMIGEDDPWAGTIRFRQWRTDGRTIFHELAHAFQDSHAEPWEDAITYSERMVEQAHLDKSFTAYAGASADAYDAERFADAFGWGFAKGSPEGLEFIVNVWKELRKPLDQ